MCIKTFFLLKARKLSVKKFKTSKNEKLAQWTMLRYSSIYEQPHISGVDRVPAMDCRSFSEFLWFNEPKYEGLTQLVIPMDRWLGFFIYYSQYRRMQGKNFNKIRSFAENLKQS